MENRPQYTVLKFGGKLVADIDKMKHIVDIVYACQQKGIKPIIVVSAMGSTTDELINLSQKASRTPSPREMDALLATGEQVSACILSMLFKARGIQATSLNALQAGIFGTGRLSGKITQINPARINALLENSTLPIITGFQAWDMENQDFITLGRGGSDMTAVKLAGQFKCPCILYKDVDGVCTTNPKEVKTAGVIPLINYEDMKKIAGNGAQVVMKEAVEEAERTGIEINIANAATPEIIGTTIRHSAPPAISIASRQKQTLIAVSAPSKYLSMVPQICADYNIHMYSFDQKGRNLFTVNDKDAPLIIRKLEGFKGFTVDSSADLVEIGIVGGIENEKGFLGRVLNIIEKNNFEPLHITTGEGSISLAVTKDAHLPILNALHDSLELGKAPKNIKKREVALPHRTKGRSPRGE